MNTPPAAERIRELEAELAAANARVAELEQVLKDAGYEPAQNAHPEGADVPEDAV